MIRLYSTGAFYFALAYPGSNLLSIAQLFSVTHVYQAFHGGEEAAVSSSLPLAKRSVLGGLLPESLLYVLERSGPVAFAAAMVSDSDTPDILDTQDASRKSDPSGSPESATGVCYLSFTPSIFC